MSGPAVVACPLIAGWYGKIPSLGDFASRRLPQTFVNAWDSWLQHGLAASRAALGETWLEIYLRSPIWRFALTPGACGDSAWAGVLLPSVDKVGRHFPLTFALELAPATLPDIWSAQSWYASLEELALSALRIDCPLDELERGLGEVPFPATDGLDPVVRELAQWWRSDSRGACLVRVASLSSLPTLFSSALLCAPGGRSIWWSVPEGSEPLPLYCFSGLPPEEHFVTLLQDLA